MANRIPHLLGLQAVLSDQPLAYTPRDIIGTYEARDHRY